MSQIHLKVLGGTRTNERRLCDSCTESVISRGSGANDERVYCQTMRTDVGIRVVECNRYQEGGKPSLWDMRRIAWVLNQDSRRQRIGFLNAAQWRAENDDNDPLDGFVD